MALLLVAPALLALASVFRADLLWPALALDAGVLLLALSDAILARRPLIGLRRTGPEVLSVGRANRFTLEIESRSRRQLTIQITVDLFDDAYSADLPFELTVAPMRTSTAEFTITPTRRGSYVLGPHTVRYASPLGVWIRQTGVELHDKIEVYPNVQAVTAYELLAKQNREQALLRPSPQRGGESEFDSLRDYRKGDEYRAIDWKATARHRRLISREYRLEEDQNIFFLLDAGRLMTGETAGLSYFDHALNATLLLGHVATRGGDRIGVASFADRVLRFSPPRRGQRALNQLVRTMYAAYPELVEPDFEAAFLEIERRVRRRSLVILFTQVVDQVNAQRILRSTRLFLRRHLLLCVMFQDTEVEALATRADHAGGVYVQAAAAEVLAQRQQLIGQLRQSGALVLDTDAADLTPSLIDRYLEVKSRRLL